MTYYEQNEDPAREYEMIWTLFQGKEEEELPRRNKEGVTVKILNFLFGSGSGKDEPPDDYREKRRFHRHVYHPSPRHMGEHPSGLDDVPKSEWTTNRLEPGMSPPGVSSSSGSGSLCHSLSRLIVAMTVASMIMILTSAANCMQIIKSAVGQGGESEPNVA